MQWRINAETLDPQGQARPASGLITHCELPSGPGVRVDSHARADLSPSPHYDSLLAKLIVSHRSGHFDDVLRRSQRALAECRIEGLATNLPLLRVLATEPALHHNSVHTRWLEEQWPRLQDRLADHTDATPAPALVQTPTPAMAGAAANITANANRQGCNDLLFDNVFMFLIP